MESEAEELKQLVPEGADALSAKSKKERFDEQSWDSLKSSPLHEILREYKDVLPDNIPSELPQNKGVQHEIDLVPGTKYCMTRQWPLPREQVKAIDDFFESRRTWRVAHRSCLQQVERCDGSGADADTTKDVIIDSMDMSTIFSALDLRNGFYQILMRESDIPLTEVSTPSGMLWQWLVMPQGLKNAPCDVQQVRHTLVVLGAQLRTELFRRCSRAVNGKSDVEMHKVHLRKLLALMRKHKLYANLKKCIFGASEIPVLGCLVGKNGVRPDPGKVRVINEWPMPSNVMELRQFLGLATYLCKYVSNYAGTIRPLSQLLQKDAAWDWTAECQQAFDAVKQGIVCDASDFAIGCTLMQHDHEGRNRVVYYQSRQLKPAECTYPVHDKELLAMKYALAKFRVYLLGSRPFVVYTDHASLRTAIKSPHIAQRMTRWLSFFAEYNFQVEYKPGRLNVVADALSRRPDYAMHETDANAIGVVRTSTPSSSLLDDVRSTYANDADAKQLLDYFAAPSDKSRLKLAKHLRARVHRYRVHNGILLYSAVDDNADRVVVNCAWSDCLPMAEFAINNSVHVSTGHTPFYVNALRRPRVPSVLGTVAPSLSGEGYPVLPEPNKHADMTNISAVSTRARTARSPFIVSTVSTPVVYTLNINEQHTQAVPVVNKDAELNTEFSSKAMEFVQRRQAVIWFGQDAIAVSVDRQKLNADNNGRCNANEFKIGSLVLLATQNLAKHAVSDFGASKLAPRFIGPFTVLAKHGNAYTLDIPSSMRLHPTFYVGRLKPYSQPESPIHGDSAPTPVRAHRRAFARQSVSTQRRPARSTRSASPAQSRLLTGPAPAVTRYTQPPGGVQQPPDDQRSLADQTRGVFRRKVLRPLVALEVICAIKFVCRAFSSSGTRTPVAVGQSLGA
ncbi:unnamed protein product [Phytophthora fragariaefolia]|uniref:Unnamed protein product n=1 Tax=Phytophthora fragariaefolia TaxID=1490495 RepID=A0A9W6Y861_9STRA|nr:unnamed protein product [Phytophthora fragariaefolia]